MRRSVALLVVIHSACFAAGQDRKHQAPGEVYDSPGQWRRAKAFIKEFTEKRLKFFDEKGQWQGPADDKPWRSLELSAYVNPFLESGNKTAVRLANAIIENNRVHQLDMAYALVRHRGRLSDKAVKKIEDLVRANAEKRFGAFRWRFQGDNDNFPLMAAATIAMWGTHTNDAKWIRGAYTRQVHYSRPGLALETEYNPATEGIRYQTVNGKVPPAPQLEATHLPPDRVPWLR